MMRYPQWGAPDTGPHGPVQIFHGGGDRAGFCRTACGEIDKTVLQGLHVVRPLTPNISATQSSSPHPSSFTVASLAHGSGLGPRLRVARVARVPGSLGLRAVRLGSQAFHLECRRLRQYKEITAATRGSIICALPQSAVVYPDSVPLLSAVRGTDRPTG